MEVINIYTNQQGISILGAGGGMLFKEKWMDTSKIDKENVHESEHVKKPDKFFKSASKWKL